MDIIIDIRPLVNGKTSGVEVYIKNLLTSIAKVDKKNRYLLFSNSYHQILPFLPQIEQENIKYLHTRIPNKVFNTLILLKLLQLDKFAVKSAKQQNIFLNFTPSVYFCPDILTTNLSTEISKIQTVHDLSFLHHPSFFSTKTKLWHKIINPKKIIQHSAKIIAVSDFTRQDLISTINIEPSKIETIHEAGMLEDPNPKQQLPFSEIIKKYNLPENYFLFLATLEPRKNIVNLLKAFKQYKSKNRNNIKLVLAGTVNDKIFQKMNLQDIDKNISTIGFVKEEDKQAIYLLAEAFFYPSVYEGFGLPIIEALQNKIPVVTSNTSALPETAGDCALYVDPESVESISRAMEQVTKPDIKRALIKNIDNHLKNFSWDKTALETVKLIENLGQR